MLDLLAGKEVPKPDYSDLIERIGAHCRENSFVATDDFLFKCIREELPSPCPTTLLPTQPDCCLSRHLPPFLLFPPLAHNSSHSHNDASLITPSPTC